MNKEITNTLETFIAEPNKTYKLEKLETTDVSHISKGHFEEGEATILHFPDNANMVLVQNYLSYLKTSPVQEIIKIEDKAIEFKTQSGSLYRLSK